MAVWSRFGVYPGNGRFQGMGNSSLSEHTPKLPNLAILEYPKVSPSLGLSGDAFRDVSGTASGTLSGTCPGHVLGASWEGPGTAFRACPEVPSGASGSAFRTPNWPFWAPEGRKRPFGPVWAIPRDMHYIRLTFGDFRAGKCPFWPILAFRSPKRPFRAGLGLVRPVWGLFRACPGLPSGTCPGRYPGRVRDTSRERFGSVLGACPEGLFQGMPGKA
jgi:hypothetical protein